MSVISPMGYLYKFDPHAPAGQRLARKRPDTPTWTVGKPDFSIQSMTPDELRFVAALIDAARLEMVK